MSQHVLGVRVLEPGAARVSIDPHLGDLEWVEGTYPTPKGLIRVRHVRRADGTVATRVEAPDGVVVDQP